MEDYKKKYEDAVKKLKKFFINDDDRILYKRDIERVFPELKESEDERIRKSLINYINYHGNAGDFTKQEFIAWIERQGEKNLSTDFSDLRTWKYIVDAVWTEKEGIGQYLDSPFTEETAKKLQKRFGNIEQKPTWSEEDEDMVEGLNNCIDELDEVNGWLYTYVNDKDVKLEDIKNWLKSLKERIKGE